MSRKVSLSLSFLIWKLRWLNSVIIKFLPMFMALLTYNCVSKGKAQSLPFLSFGQVTASGLKPLPDFLLVATRWQERATVVGPKLQVRASEADLSRYLSDLGGQRVTFCNSKTFCLWKHSLLCKIESWELVRIILKMPQGLNKVNKLSVFPAHRELPLWWGA